MDQVLIYARYSTTLQREASIEDQVRICREAAEREGWAVTGIHTDYAISGGVRDRPGLNGLLEAVGRGAGTVILAESIDRLSRDQEDIAAIFKRVAFAGARIFTLSEGWVGELHVGLKGTMSALFRKDLADKTRRGQTGRVLAGFNPGGRAYGYQRVARFDERGEPIHGLREIDPDEAAIVRRIYAEFVDGRSPREIARRLNGEGVAAPAGGKWSAASINGDRVRGNGILQNDIYRGVLVFNRTRRFQDPDTRKKRIRPRPPEEWTVRPAPELQIVSDELWEAVSARRARFDGTRAEQQRRPKRLLSGLVRCASCGGRYVVIGAEKWGCGNRRERGDCGNGRTIQTHLLEARVLAGLQEQLLDPDLVAEVVREYRRAAQERAGTEAKERARAERRRDKAKRDVDRLIRAVTDGGAEFGEIRSALEKSRADLAAAELAIADVGAGAVIALHPGVADDYRRRITNLRELLTGPEDASRAAAQQVRALIDHVTVAPAEGRTGTVITIEGRLTALLDLAAGRAVNSVDVCQRWCPTDDRSGHSNHWTISVSRS
ncbi:recombinase family protein [Sphingomonas ginkgonis]|nr:recombinase family protein [Sphingomonas ginkgonis]